MRILVTGGLGFMGANLLPKLLCDPAVEQTTVIDNLRHTANPEILPDLRRTPRFEFIKGDIRDAGLMDRQVQRHDAVINLAAETFVDLSIADSKPFVETNLLGTHTILDAIRHRAVKKFIHVSTDEVWGEARGEERFTEASAYSPRNPYAATKAGADHLVRAFGETYDIPYNIVYFSNLYGPWQFPEKLIPKSIVNLIVGRMLTLYADGSQIRTWLHVDDANRGLIEVLKNAPNRESYALGSNIELSNLEVARTLLAIFGKAEDEIAFVEDRPGHDFRYAVDSSRALQHLGWEPQVDFHRGLAEKVKWFREHEDWWRRKRVG